MTLFGRWICRYRGHLLHRVGKVDTGMCWATVYGCVRCGARTTTPPEA